MPRYIDADKLLESLRESYNAAQEWYDKAKDDERAEQALMDFTECILRVKEQPTADVQEVKHGKWKYDERYGMFFCSACRDLATRNTYNFCHNCGAKMDKEKEE